MRRLSFLSNFRVDICRNDWVRVCDSVRLEELNSNLMPNESHTFAERSSGTRRLVNRLQHVVGVATEQQHIKGPTTIRIRRQGGLRASVDRLKPIMPIEMHASRRRPQKTTTTTTEEQIQAAVELQEHGHFNSIFFFFS